MLYSHQIQDTRHKDSNFDIHVPGTHPMKHLHIVNSHYILILYASISPYSVMSLPPKTCKLFLIIFCFLPVSGEMAQELQCLQLTQNTTLVPSSYKEIHHCL